MKIDPESGKTEPVVIGGEMVLDQTAEKPTCSTTCGGR